MSHDHHADDVHKTQHSPTARSTPPLSPPSIGQIEMSTIGDSSESETYVAHNQKWKLGASGESLNEDVRKISWSVLCPDGTVVKQGIAPEHMKPYDYFLGTFPISHLPLIVSLTNYNLRAENCLETSAVEVLAFIGTLLLMTQVKFSERRELWSRQSHSDFLSVPNVSRVMSQVRFKSLLCCIRFSLQSRQWQLCEGFVDAINQHRLQHVTSSELLCVDESISRWYGLGGSWIEVGSPHYVALNRKPENGLEIQNIACGRLGIILGLKLVKSAVETTRISSQSHEALNHGTKIVVDLCTPWNDKERIVCADSYYASVEVAETLLEKSAIYWCHQIMYKKISHGIFE